MTYSLVCRLYHYFLCSKFDALVSETEECGDAGFSLGALMHAAVCHELEGVLCVRNWVLSLEIFAFSWYVSNRAHLLTQVFTCLSLALTVKLAVPCLTLVVEIRGETHATKLFSEHPQRHCSALLFLCL